VDDPGARQTGALLKALKAPAALLQVAQLQHDPFTGAALLQLVMAERQRRAALQGRDLAGELAMRVMQRQPRRISITLSYQVHEGLLTRSEEEGRSLSNLCAFLLEEALRDSSRLMFDGKTMPGKPPLPMGDGQLPTRREFQGESWRPRH
jgi:hypothetical protein